MPLFYFRYLREIGYTDTIIDVRSSRVRQLLGVQVHNAENETNRIIMNGEAKRYVREICSELLVLLHILVQWTVEISF